MDFSVLWTKRDIVAGGGEPLVQVNLYIALHLVLNPTVTEEEQK